MWSEPVTTVQPASEPVSLAEAKEFLSIDSDEIEFDTLLGSLIAVARQQVEAITGLRLVEQTVELAASDTNDLARLPIGPVSAITAFVYDDSAGAELAFADTEWELFGAGLSRGVRLQVGKSWPGSIRNVEGAIRLTATVGYDELPKTLWLAILLMVGDAFANRETAVTGTVAAKIPMSVTVDNLLCNFRMYA